MSGQECPGAGREARRTARTWSSGTRTRAATKAGERKLPIEERMLFDVAGQVEERVGERRAEEGEHLDARHGVEDAEGAQREEPGSEPGLEARPAAGEAEQDESDEPEGRGEGDVRVRGDSRRP